MLLHISVTGKNAHLGLYIRILLYVAAWHSNWLLHIIIWTGSVCHKWPQCKDIWTWDTALAVEGMLFCCYACFILFQILLWNANPYLFIPLFVGANAVTLLQVIKTGNSCAACNVYSLGKISNSLYSVRVLWTVYMKMGSSIAIYVCSVWGTFSMVDKHSMCSTGLALLHNDL